MTKEKEICIGILNRFYVWFIWKKCVSAKAFRTFRTETIKTSSEVFGISF